MKKRLLLMIGLAVLVSIFCEGIILDRVEAFIGGGAVVGRADETTDSEEPRVISVKKVSGDISLDPFAPVWADAPSTTIALVPQNVAEPMEFSPAVKQVAVNAVMNQKEIALRLEWVDPHKNSFALRHEDYRDSAAIMFPVDPTGEMPPEEVQEILPFMGDDGSAVNIWHWKADWEREQGVELPLDDFQYPNMQADYYINEEEGTDRAVPAATSDTGEYCSDCVGNANKSKKLGHAKVAAQTIMSSEGDNQGVYDAATHLNNILAKESLRFSSVEDLNAEGFGTLTTQDSQDVKGYGVHGNNVWRITVKRTIATKDKGDTQFSKFDGFVPIAFAVWEGSQGERDGLKGRSTWHYLKVK